MVLNDVADVIRPDLVNGDRPRLPPGRPEGLQHRPRRVLMRAYFHLSRARLLWDGAPAGGAGGPRGPAHEGPGATPERLAPRACHVTGLDMARQAFGGPAAARPRGAVAPLPPGTFEFGGDTWDAHRAEAPAAALHAREHGSSSSDEADLDADDDDLCLTVQKMPFEACRADVQLRLRLSPARRRPRADGHLGGILKRLRVAAVSGCWFSRDLAGWSTGRAPWTGGGGRAGTRPSACSHPPAASPLSGLPGPRGLVRGQTVPT